MRGSLLPDCRQKRLIWRWGSRSAQRSRCQGQPLLMKNCHCASIQPQRPYKDMNSHVQHSSQFVYQAEGLQKFKRGVRKHGDM